MKVRADGCRIAFCSSLWTAEPFGGAGGTGDPRHNAVFIIDPKSPSVKAIDAAIEEVAKEKWKDKAPGILKKLITDGNVCLVKADYEDKNGEVYDGFEGMFYLRASSAQRPLVIDRDKTSLVPSDGRPYAGCYVNGQVDIWAQDNSFGRRINAQLSGVQFLRDGDAFSGGAPAKADDFDDMADQGEEEDSLV